MKSMTGFGKATLESPWARLTVKVRSVNSRYLDLDLKIPFWLQAMENEIKKELKKVFHRGRVELVLHPEWMARTPYQISLDPELIAAAYRNLSAVQKEKEIPGTLGMDTIVSLPGLVVLDATDLSLDAGQAAEVLGVVAGAAAAVDAMRRTEGETLKVEIERELTGIEQVVGGIEGLSAGVAAAAFEKLRTRLETYRLEQDLDQGRLVQEAAFIAERSDITEEVARLKSHAAQFRALVERAGPCGKEMDFLVQEMMREIGTLSAKARAPEVTALVVEVKSGLEKIREQARNIE
jgi:uncharacterized protein (TIGR00255 family)